MQKDRVTFIRTVAFAWALVAGAAWGQVVIPAGGSFDVPAGGSFDFGCAVVDVAGTVNADGDLASGNLIIRGTGVVNGSTGSIGVAGDWDNAGTFNAGSGTVSFVDGCGAASATISGSSTFNNLTLSSTNGRSFVIPAGSNITVNGTLTLQGAPGTPINLVSSSGQLAVINLGPTAQVVNNGAVLSNVRIGAALASATPASIPTLDDYGKILLALLTAAMGLLAVRHSSTKKI